MEVHLGVVCDSCGKLDFRGRRYKCLQCSDYDECENCHTNTLSSANHPTDHPVQCILTEQDFSERFLTPRMVCILHDEGIPTGNVCAVAFTCPYCVLRGFTAKRLLQHTETYHTYKIDNGKPVCCPICAASSGRASVDRNSFVYCLSEHISSVHKTFLGNITTESEAYALPALAGSYAESRTSSSAGQTGLAPPQ